MGTKVDPHMAYVKCASELAARRAQVKALRKIAKRLYESLINAGAWTREQSEAAKYYEKEMK